MFGPQGAKRYPNLSTPRQRGTSPWESWYSGVVNQTAYAAVAHAVDNIYCLPVVIGKGGFIDRVAFEVTTGGAAGSVGRCGIYRATSRKNIYPGALVVDGGEKDTTSSGVKSTTVNVFLRAGLYYFCMLTGVAAPTLRDLAVASASPILGLPTTMGANNHYHVTVAFPYAALPSAFPASATPGVSSRLGLVHVRFAS